MTPQSDLSLLILTMAVAAFACRASGFWFMRFVPITPRIEAALRATPLAVMIGIVSPAALSGRVPEMVALAVTILLRHLTGGDLIGAFSGVVVVAVFRVLGWG